MQVKEIALSELKPYEKNPRKNDKAVETVAKSIEEFGFKVPIVIDSDNVIVCGHTRYKAAQKLGLEFIPCVIADDLTPEQIKAFRLVDNKTAELAVWDFEKLDEELSVLSDLGELTFDMNDFGFITHNMDINDFFEEIKPTPQSAPPNNSSQKQNAKPQEQTVQSQEIKPNTPIGADKSSDEKTQNVICPHCGKGFLL